MNTGEALGGGGGGGGLYPYGNDNHVNIDKVVTTLWIGCHYLVTRL